MSRFIDEGLGGGTEPHGASRGREACEAASGDLGLLSSEPNNLQAGSNLLRGNQLALAGAGTHRAGVLPVLGRGNVTLPERPRFTLRRPDRVDGAALLAIEKDAVAVGLLAQGQAAGRSLGI